MAKDIKLTEGTANALKVLGGFEDFALIKDLKDASPDLNIASAHMTSLVRNGLAEATDVEVEVVEVKVYKGYRLTDAGRDFLGSDAE